MNNPKTHIIKSINISYENLQVKIGNRWVYLKPSDLVGTKIKGIIEKRRTRTWLVKK